MQVFTSWWLMRAFALACILLAQQLQAYPSFYADLALCTIPDQGYGPHGGVLQDPSISFSLHDASGAAVSTWHANGVYTLIITAASEVQAFVHATTGSFKRVPGQGGGVTSECPSSFFSTAEERSHSVTWTAPDTHEEVTISAAVAPGTVDYRTNQVTIRRAAGSGSDSTPDDAAVHEPLPRATHEEVVKAPDLRPKQPHADESVQSQDTHETLPMRATAPNLKPKHQATQGAEGAHETLPERVLAPDLKNDHRPQISGDDAAERLPQGVRLENPLRRDHEDSVYQGAGQSGQGVVEEAPKAQSLRRYARPRATVQKVREDQEATSKRGAEADEISRQAQRRREEELGPLPVSGVWGVVPLLFAAVGAAAAAFALLCMLCNRHKYGKGRKRRLLPH